MKQLKLPAVFMRGGTSKAIVFRQEDLPAQRAAWDEIFLAAIGSPDPSGRQLDGMGGGVSSLSKVCIVGPSSRPDAAAAARWGPAHRIPEHGLTSRGSLRQAASGWKPAPVSPPGACFTWTTGASASLTRTASAVLCETMCDG